LAKLATVGMQARQWRGRRGGKGVARAAPPPTSDDPGAPLWIVVSIRIQTFRYQNDPIRCHVQVKRPGIWKGNAINSMAQKPRALETQLGSRRDPSWNPGFNITICVPRTRTSNQPGVCGSALTSVPVALVIKREEKNKRIWDLREKRHKGVEKGDKAFLESAGYTFFGMHGKDGGHPKVAAPQT
jgi:hypothetical protein